MENWLAALTADSFRAVWRDGQIVAGLGLIHMGQWFGGIRVPMVGITAVGVAAAQRGSGVGSLLLRRTLEDLHTAGVALSALYPATLPFYQRVGYMRAGQRLTYEMPLEAIDVREQTGDLVPVASEEYAELYQMYNQRARRSSGNLDRPAWMWRDKIEPKDAQPFRFLVIHDHQPQGYVVFTQGGRHDPLTILDICVLTPTAGRRLLSLFAGYRSMVESLTWSGGPKDPFLYLIGENLTGGMHVKVRVTRSLEWMLRIIDVEQALSKRGYPPGLNVELHLDIRDDLLPTNNQRFVLQVADGCGKVSPGGKGHITLGIGELAAVYSGFMTPGELSALGTINGPETDLAVAGTVFSGPRPWIADMF
jgi:predicted acetyltransferase